MPKIYLDMDCVLADFMKHFNRTIYNAGLVVKDFDNHKEKILAYKDWWLSMPPMPDSGHLVNGCLDMNSDVWILSARPEWDIDAERQKKAWMRKYFPIIDTNKVIITRSKDKQKWAHPEDILVDDYIRNINEWKAAGGIAVHHTSASKSLNEIRRFYSNK